MERKLETWKGALKSKISTINVRKKEILISSENGLLSQFKASQKLCPSQINQGKRIFSEIIIEIFMMQSTAAFFQIH